MQSDLIGLAPSGRSHPRDDDQFTEEGFIQVLQAAGSSGDAVKQLVAQILVATSSHRLRDAAALALIDLGAQDQADALLRAIDRPDLAQHTGTLIFALSELGVPMPLQTVVHIVEKGSYEAKAETLLLVEQGRVAVPSDASVLRDLRAALAGLQLSADRDVSDAAAMVLSSLG